MKLMRIGRKVKRPNTIRFGATNSQPMRETPSRRCPSRNSGSNRLKNNPRRRVSKGKALAYFWACLTASAMSAAILVMASSVLISPTMACVTRATVGSMMARLNR